MGTSLNVRDTISADKSWLRREVRYVGEPRGVRLSAPVCFTSPV